MRLGRDEETSDHLGPGIFLRLRKSWAWVTWPDEMGAPVLLALTVNMSSMHEHRQNAFGNLFFRAKSSRHTPTAN